MNHSGISANIVVAADDNYVPHVGAMLHSLFTSNPRLKCHIDFLHRPDLSMNALVSLQRLCERYDAEFSACVVPVSKLPKARFGKEYPQEAWYRLILPSLLPERRRVLWIDADALVLRDIAPLWGVELEGAELAAVPNALSWRRNGYADGIGVQADAHRYFSTGVMVMDLQAMRASKAEERLAASLELAPEGIAWADQDVFNPVYADSYCQLPLFWNMTSGTYYFVRENLAVHGWARYLEARQHPRIVHFTIPWMKPWTAGVRHPFAKLYWQHREAAGWSDAGARRASLGGMQLPIAFRAFLFALRRRQFRGAVQVLRFNLICLAGRFWRFST